MSETKSGGRGVLLALLGALCWGFSATCASYLMQTFGISVTWLVSIRLIVAGSLFFILALVKARDTIAELLHDKKMVALVAAYAVVGMILMQTTYMMAVRYAGAGNALLLQETGLVLIMLTACIKGHRRPHTHEVVCILLAIGGTLSIATQGNLGSLGIAPLGLAWGLIAGVCLAGYNIVPVKLLDSYGSTVTNGLSMPLAAVLFLPIGQPWNAPSLPVEGIAALLAVCLIGTFVAYLAYLEGVKVAGPVKASLVAVFEPVSAMVFSLVWLGDAITLWEGIGCVLIVIMMLLVAKPEA